MTNTRAQSGTRAPTRRLVLSWIAGFLAVILLAEGGVRVLSSHLSDPVDYINLQTQAFVRDMNVLQAHHVKSDITFVGNSLVQRGIATKLVEKELPDAKWVHNVAIGGFETPVLKRWVLEEVVPRLHPKRVVIGVSSSDFNAGRADSTKSILKYDEARKTQPGFYGAADRILEASALSDYRDDLRDPYELLQAAQGHTKHMPVSGSGTLKDRATWPLGYKTVSEAQLARGRKTELAYICGQQLRQFHVGADEMQAFEDTVRQLRAKRIEVVVVLMPVSSQYIGCHPRGEKDQSEWAAAVVAAGARQKVPVLDLAHSMPDDAYRDYEHLDTAPAKEFTTQLIGRLRKLGW